ncbi:hypothetical protein M011DRAFT_474696 [Sporormia fimetaria CBS 119925]|uniref:Uncharacterized protein n=1 Tax=Sporormia fimetaria CBS 119925 TaxID=1340428 RepID=A0A6A6VLY4_9PLEO|nr:hypothetical protein M011DRAFT_474696 [Sporormia fimetaria CBS 119925]
MDQPRKPFREIAPHPPPTPTNEAPPASQSSTVGLMLPPPVPVRASSSQMREIAPRPDPSHWAPPTARGSSVGLMFPPPVEGPVLVSPLPDLTPTPLTQAALTAKDSTAGLMLPPPVPGRNSPDSSPLSSPPTSPIPPDEKPEPSQIQSVQLLEEHLTITYVHDWIKRIFPRSFSCLPLAKDIEWVKIRREGYLPKMLRIGYIKRYPSSYNKLYMLQTTGNRFHVYEEDEWLDVVTIDPEDVFPAASFRELFKVKDFIARMKLVYALAAYYFLRGEVSKSFVARAGEKLSPSLGALAEAVVMDAGEVGKKEVEMLEQAELARGSTAVGMIYIGLSDDMNSMESLDEIWRQLGKDERRIE